jgi:rhamnosyl/mannosyltransferase
VKILHLSKFYPPDKGGLEQVVAGLAEGAAARGHDVRVVSATGLSRLRPPGKRSTEPPQHRVVVVRCPTAAIVWSQPIAPAYLAAARWPADVIHLHHPHPLADLATLLGPRAPLVVTHHSDVRRQALARPVYWPLLRMVLRRAAAIVVPTRAHVSVSAELRGHEAKVRVIPFGVDHVRFGPRAGAARPAAFPAAGPVGLFVGRLVGYKGLDVLLDAVSGSDLQLVIVGDGPLRHWLEAEVARRRLGGQVTLAGDVAAEDLPRYYQAADYLVLPSTTPAEMFGIVLLEAMACARPLITTALPTGVREVNRAGETGLEVPVGDAAALRGAMQRLAGNADLRGQLGRAGRARVERHFSLGRMIDAHLRLYQEVTGGQE